MKELIKEEVNFDSTKYKELDPFNEEDWDEYEIKTGDVFYFFNLKNGTITTGIGKAGLKNDKFTLNITKSTDTSLVGKEVAMSDNTRTNINNNQYDNHQNNVGNGNKIISLVNNFKFREYYKNIHETIRRALHNNIKTLSNNINAIERDMDNSEEAVIVLKKDLKSHDEFPKTDEIKLLDDNYIVIRTRQNANGGIDVNLSLYEMSDKKDEKGGYHLVNTETGEKGPYINQTFEKLKANGYLLLKSKRGENDRTYITRDMEYYEKFIEKIISSTNEEIGKKIEDYRKKYRDSIEKVSKMRDELDKERQSYLEFNFSEIVDKLKKLTKE